MRQARMRLAVQYCPYCGEQELRPLEDHAEAWTCADCRTSFVVSPVPVTSTTAVAGGTA